jgi:hypothetical protein
MVGYEMVQLSSDDARYIDEILKASNKSTSSIALLKKSDSLENGSTLKTNSLAGYPIRNSGHSDSLIVNHLIRNNSQWDSVDQVQTLIEINSLPETGRVATLEKQKILVKSFFWLYGSGTYFEIMFWTIFGVLASILYFVSEVIRDKKENFDHTEIPSQLAKLFYAPIISIILIFSYEYATDGNAIALDATKGVLIVSFLLGFYSGRAMELLNRVKELLLPYSSTYKANKVVSNTESAKEIIIDLEIPQQQIPPDGDYELIKNQLGKAQVKLINKTTNEEILLEKSGEEQEGIFKGKAKPSIHTIKVTLNTTEGFAYSATDEINVEKEDKKVVNLIKDQGNG